MTALSTFRSSLTPAFAPVPALPRPEAAPRLVVRAGPKPWLDKPALTMRGPGDDWSHKKFLVEDRLKRREREAGQAWDTMRHSLPSNAVAVVVAAAALASGDLPLLGATTVLGCIAPFAFGLEMGFPIGVAAIGALVSAATNDNAEAARFMIAAGAPAFALIETLSAAARGLKLEQAARTLRAEKKLLEATRPPDESES